MITLFFDTPDLKGLYSYQDEQHLTQYVESNPELKGSYTIVNLSEYPGCGLWPNCFSGTRGEDGTLAVSFDLEAARASALITLDSYYARACTKLKRDYDPLEISAYAMASPEERDPKLTETLNTLSNIRTQKKDFLEQLKTAPNAMRLTEVLNLVISVWSLEGNDLGAVSFINGFCKSPHA